jgi:hypothetical protein
MKMESMSNNIVNIMFELSKNEGLARLLVNNVDNPFETPVNNSTSLITPNANESKIYPYPFDPEATVTDGSFIRVYYNDGEFSDNEAIAESQLHIDIIVAKSLWLINDGQKSLIRPYEIMGRVIDMVGKKSLNSTIKLKFEGYQHLAVNTKFDAIRLYSNYMSVESQYRHE